MADLANAVNDVSAAYRHIGAADAVDEVIRTIEQRGTSGLVNELTKRAGEEQQRGSKDYSAGQSQLSAATIPYSMDFTDAYTARLKELGATAGTAGSYETQAIADVRVGIKDNEKPQNRVRQGVRGDDRVGGRQRAHRTGQRIPPDRVAIRRPAGFG